MNQAQATQTAPRKVRRWKWTQRMQIHYKGATFEALMGCLKSGILVQLERRTITIANGKEPRIEIARGSVWVPNRDLARTTDGGTEYNLYPDAYAALRGCLHTMDRYGIDSERPATESAELEEMVLMARGLAKAMLQKAKLDPSIRAANEAAQKDLGTTLLKKRDDNKQMAGYRFKRALRVAAADRLGRPNPSGAAMGIYAGAEYLEKRQSEIEKIDDRIEARVSILMKFIDYHLSAYDALWSELDGEPRPQTHGAIWQHFVVIAAGATPNAVPFAKERAAEELQKLCDRLLAHQSAFRRMQVAPFRRNASHLVRDLDVILNKLLPHATHTDAFVSELQERLETIERGILWVYELNLLHFELLAPLSFHLERSRADWQKRMRALPTDAAIPFETEIAHAPCFDFVMPELAALDARITHKCSDKNLRKPVKTKVQRLISAALHAAEAKQWLTVKERLKGITMIL